MSRRSNMEEHRTDEIATEATGGRDAERSNPKPNQQAGGTSDFGRCKRGKPIEWHIHCAQCFDDLRMPTKLHGSGANELHREQGTHDDGCYEHGIPHFRRPERPAHLSVAQERRGSLDTSKPLRSYSSVAAAAVVASVAAARREWRYSIAIGASEITRISTAA